MENQKNEGPLRTGHRTMQEAMPVSQDNKSEAKNLDAANRDQWISLLGRIVASDRDEKATPLSEVERTSMEWLWSNRIPKGAVSIIEGDGGRGKSTIIADIASRLSAGRRLPDDDLDRDPMKILLLATEDDPGAVLRPRFERNDGNLKNIFLRDQAIILDTNGLSILLRTILELRIDVVVVDPIVSFLGQKIDMNKGNDVRSVLGPLGKIGRETGCTIIVVRHFNKSREASAAQRGAGSVDFRNAARSVLQVIGDAERSYLALEKSNYAVRARTLPFVITADGVSWGEPTDQTADELHSDAQVTVDRSALGEAIHFLETELCEPKAAKEALRAAREIGISENTLQRASKQLRIKKQKTQAGWIWSMPKQDGQDGQSSGPGHLDHLAANHSSNREIFGVSSQKKDTERETRQAVNLKVVRPDFGLPITRQ